MLFSCSLFGLKKHSLKDAFLRNVVLNDESRPVTGGRVVTAEELHVICAQIIVVILVEAQAELGGAGQVDVGIPRASNDGAVPVVDRRGAECGY